jgi:hypothetical protein
MVKLAIEHQYYGPKVTGGRWLLLACSVRDVVVFDETKDEEQIKAVTSN